MDNSLLSRTTLDSLQTEQTEQHQARPSNPLLEALSLMKEHPVECATATAVAAGGLALLVASRGRGTGAFAESLQVSARSIGTFSAEGYSFVPQRASIFLNPAEFRLAAPKTSMSAFDAANYRWVAPRSILEKITSPPWMRGL